MNKITAKYGYTLDGGPLGDIEDETFSADGMKFVFTGVSAHPGYAKGKMVNAIKLASAFVSRLPKEEWSPETTSGRDGFVHPVSIQGGLEEATVQFILRDHDTEKMNSYANRLISIADEVMAEFPGAAYRFDRSEQYRNMKEKLVDVPFVTEYAAQAMKRAGVQPRRAIIRGGTDGSRLSFMGVPCPNLFTGEMAIHSKHEYVSVQDMEKAVATLRELAQIWEKHEA
jgi:tripeptide aminopeptidase